MKFTGKIIWSADNLTDKELLEIVTGADFPREKVAVKLDRLFLTKYGLAMIRRVQEEAGVAVFADAKIVEIPSKTLEIVKVHLEYQPWMLNVMAGICNTGVVPRVVLVDDDEVPDDVLCEFAKLCKEAGTKSCVVTVLTSKTDELAMWEFGRDSNRQVMRYADLAHYAGLTDLVCSPLEARVLSQKGLASEIVLNTPGVRLMTSSRDDQSRVATPREALEAGARRLVIGRDLSRDGKFLENLAKIEADMAGETIKSPV